MKYIVKNCPCYCEGTVIQGNEQLTQACQSLHRVVKEGKIGLKKCSDIDDCVIKQIVGICKDVKEKDPIVAERDKQTGKIISIGGWIGNPVYDFAQKILQVLEIEEAE